MARQEFPIAGIGVPFLSLHEKIATNDGSATGSDYEQSSPLPGNAEPQQTGSVFVPIISGNQQSELTLDVVSGGQPIASLNSSCGLVYRFNGESNTDARGWTPPNMITDVYVASLSALTDYTRFNLACHPVTKRLFVSYAQSSTTDRYVRVFNPETTSWNGAAVSVSSLSADSDFLYCNKNGRLLQIVRNKVYRSDDNAATWSLHSENVFPISMDTNVFTDIAQVGSAINSFGEILYVAKISASNKLLQLVSSDNLSSFEFIDSKGNCGSHPTVAPLSNGSMILGYIRDSDRYACVRILASPRSEFSEQIEIIVDAEDCEHMFLSCENDGLIYAHITTATAETKLFASDDGGRTWTQFQSGVAYGNASNWMFGDRNVTTPTSVFANGSLWCLARWKAGTTTGYNGNIALIRMGGWESLTSRPDDTESASDRQISYRIGSSDIWYPYEFPNNVDWTSTGAGSATQNASSRPCMRIATTANQKYFSQTMSGSVAAASTYSTLAVVSGGSLSADQITVERQVTNGTNKWGIKLRFTTTQIRAIDINAGTTLATSSSLTASQIINVAMRVCDGTSGVWYKLPSENKWTLLWSGSLTSAAGTTNSYQFGHSSASTSTSDWYFVMDANKSGWGSTLSGSYNKLSRPVSSSPIQLPLDTGDTTNGPAYLSGTGGSAYLNESYLITPKYQYEVTNVFAFHSPSPSKEWRSTTTADQIVAFDFTNNYPCGAIIAAPFLNTNFRTANLDVYSGGVWTTVGTYNASKGFDNASLVYSLDGNCITPHATTVQAERYIWNNEFVGGYVILGGTKARKILSNEAGVWTASSGYKKPRIIIDGIDGTESASGSIVIVSPNGVFTFTLSTEQAYRRWRIRIPNQVIPDSYFKAGLMGLYSVTAFSIPDDGWRNEAEMTQEISYDSKGTSYVKKKGAIKRTKTIGWANSGAFGGDIYSQTPKYLSATGSTLAACTLHDIYETIYGLAELSGDQPVIYINKIDWGGAESINDRRRFLYSRIVSTIAEDHVNGEENYYEYTRPASITLEEVI